MTLLTPDTTTNTSTARTPLLDQAARGADNALNSTRRAAHGMVDDLGDRLRDLRDAADPAIDRTADQAADLARRGADALRERSRSIADGARASTDTLRHYVQDEPVKSVLMAAAAGAMLVTLARLLAPRR